jgi:hypothetical protein
MPLMEVIKKDALFELRLQAHPEIAQKRISRNQVASASGVFSMEVHGVQGKASIAASGKKEERRDRRDRFAEFV